MSTKKTPGYICWLAMRNRCRNPKATQFGNYGARGITVCDRWRDSFENFIVDVGPRPSPKHSIDRIDNNGNYEPGNCRWATQKEQTRNTRQTRRVEWRGVVRPLVEWAEVLAVPYKMLHGRIHVMGWDVDRAFTQPPGPQSHPHRDRRVRP